MVAAAVRAYRPDPARARRLRGGAYWNRGSCLRSARRVRNTPDSLEPAYGFRVAMDQEA